MAMNEYGTMPPLNMKIMVMDRPNDLMQKADVKLRKARLKYKIDLDCRAKHRRSFKTDDLVYIDNPPMQRRRQQKKTSTENQSVKLRLKKAGPYRVGRATPHMVTVDIDGLHKFVRIDRVTLARVVYEDGRDAEGQERDDEFAARVADTPDARQADGPRTESEAPRSSTAEIADGHEPTASAPTADVKNDGKP